MERILSQDEVLDAGREFDGEGIEYGGEYGQQVCEINGDDEIPFTGIVYELYDSRNVQYYSRYEDGVSNGADVSFYENGGIKSYSTMNRGTVHGTKTCWRENGVIESETTYKYGFVIEIKEWNEEGVLINEEQPILKDYEKSMIEKYDSIG